MPELPEVETVTRQLKDKVLYKTIILVEINDKNVMDIKIKKNLPARIIDITRRGKSIIFHLDTKKYLLAHLRMTGHFYYNTQQPYTAGTFHFADETFLAHNTIRKFGGIILLTEEKLQQTLSKIGPEPFDISPAEFAETIQRYPNANIKNKLLDQSFIAGIGNIYAQEAMYFAKIHPHKTVKEVPTKKLQTLHKEMQRILQLSIDNNGTTVYNYGHIDGKGDFQHLLAVYTKERCPKNHPVHKIQLAGRGTYYCKTCQS